MKGERSTDEQIIRTLHEAEAGVSVAGICRKHNCSEQSFYRWKARFGGMDASEVKRLRELERENAEVKKMVATSTRYPHAEGRQQPKVVSLAERRRCVTYLRNTHATSERRA